MILSDAALEPPDTSVDGPDAPWESSELQEYHYLDMFLKIAQIAADHGILIMMAAHRLRPNAWPGLGLWYDGLLSEQRVLASWDRLADKLCSQWK